MTTWLPVANITDTMQCLHDVELEEASEFSLEIVCILAEGRQKWHPFSSGMWVGYLGGVWSYFLQACAERKRRGQLVGRLIQQGSEVMKDDLGIPPLMPRWFGYRAVHLSHASTLIRQRPEHYARLWPEVPLDMPMLWPQNVDGHFDFSVRLTRSDRALVVRGERVLPVAGEFLGRMTR
jgi:hypothetical protein